MCLRLWCRDDLYYTGDTLRQLFGPTPDKALLANPAAFSDKVQEIHDCYRNIQMVAPRAVDLFQAHLNRYPDNKNVHEPHIAETQAYKEIAKAEIKLFDTLVAWQNNGRKIDDPSGAIRRGLMEADNLYKAAYPVTMKWVDRMFPIVEGQLVNPDRYEYERYANELQARSRGIEAMLTLPTGQEADMSFLGPEHTVVER